MLLDKTIKVKWGNSNRQYYESLGFIWTSNKDYIEIKTSQLPKGSNVIVDYSCDYCGEITSLKNQSYTKKSNEIINKDACSKCQYLKTKETLMITHGVDSVFKLDTIKARNKAVMQERYGTDNALKSGELRNLALETKKFNYFNTTLRKLYEDNGCELISTIDEYESIKKSHLKFKCGCGEIYSKRVVEFKKSPRCDKCVELLKLIKNRKEAIDFINSNNNSCKLISEECEYKNSSSELRFMCNCGEEFITTYINFKHEDKRQCTPCGRLKVSGENSHMWKGGVTTDNTKFRFSSDYKIWKQATLIRDSYTCQCCCDNTGGNLQVHHIENFSENYNSRLDINNAIVMCDICHDFRNKGSFHHLYTTRNNDIHQLQEYFDDTRSLLNLPPIDIIEDIIYKDYIFED